MLGKAQTHETGTSMVQTALTELDTGADIALKVRLSCSDFCDLRGKIVKIIAQDAVVREIDLTQFNGAENETDEFVVKVPNRPGPYTWTAVFPAQEKGDVLHQESSASFSFIFQPHSISIAVWGIPSPIPFGDAFRIMVGVKCSAGCKLTGEKVDIYDHEGAKVATGMLGDIPWSSIGALYWTEVKLKAPNTEEYYKWEVKFPTPDLEVAHKEASSIFGFKTARLPEHVVTVEVLDYETKTPIENAQVVLHPYRSSTDECGVAKVEVPKGKYKLYVSKEKYETFQITVNVASDVGLEAELVAVPVLEGDF